MFSFLGKSKSIDVVASVNGMIKAIEDVNDPVFAEKIMGDGIAIQYEGGDVYAPVSGELASVILPSCHAFGIKTKEGLEVLVHVGLETVNLKGEEFQLLKKQGDIVSAGEKILQVNEKLLRSQSCSLVTPIVVLDSSGFSIQKKASANTEAIGGKTVIFRCISSQ